METKTTTSSSRVKTRIDGQLIVAASVLGAIVFCVGYLWLSWNPFVLWKPHQQALANKLGVDGVDLANQPYFPLEYFWQELRPGTPITEVHSAIRGYSKSYTCGTNLEVYYFFSFYDDWALRFEILYNDNLKLQAIRGEDEDSRRIVVADCSYGLLPEGP